MLKWSIAQSEQKCKAACQRSENKNAVHHEAMHCRGSVIVARFLAELAPDVECGNEEREHQQHNDHPAAAAILKALHLAPLGIHGGVDVIGQRLKDLRLVQNLRARVAISLYFKSSSSISHTAVMGVE